MESSSNANTRLVVERRLRLPFLDAQTGVAQSDCALWMAHWQRMPGQGDGQLYSYPARRWRKKRRQYLMNDRYLGAATRLREPEYTDADMHQISVLENTAAAGGRDGSEEGLDKMAGGGMPPEDSNQSWYRDLEDTETSLLEPQVPPVTEFTEDPETDTEDYDETYSRKKKKKAKNSGQKKRTRIEYTDAEKPYSCEICGVRYKTRPGLSYHYAHSHIAGSNSGSGGDSHHSTAGGSSSQSSSAPPPGAAHPQQAVPPHPASSAGEDSVGPDGGGYGGVPKGTGQAGGDSPLAGLRKFQDNFLSFLKTPQNSEGGGKPAGMPGPLPPGAVPGMPHPMAQGVMPQGIPPHQQMPPGLEAPRGEGMVDTQGRSASGKPLANPSPYCDFCLGDNGENKKTRQPEELVSCSDCGRSAHPSCLQFTPNMTLSVKKYRWQCIECKSCGLCGTSDNDDQLLFCDDCDRGYHMYCLTPPLSEPPEGLWSCHLCIEEYGQGGQRGPGPSP